MNKQTFCEASLAKIQQSIDLLSAKRLKADDSLAEIFSDIIGEAEFEKKCLLIFMNDSNEDLSSCEGYIEHIEGKLTAFALPIL